MKQRYATLEALFEAIDRIVAEGRKAAEQHPIKVTDLKHGDKFVYYHSGAQTLVFGEVVLEVEDEEETECIKDALENGYVFTKCYSTVCPRGELGDTHITRIELLLSDELFNTARTNGWRNIVRCN